MKNKKFIVQITSHFIFLLASPLSRAIKLREDFATISFLLLRLKCCEKLFDDYTLMTSSRDFREEFQ